MPEGNRRSSNNRQNSQDFNWSTYHDKQLSLFDTLNRSFNQSTKLNADIGKGLASTTTILMSIANSLSNSNKRTHSSRSNHNSNKNATADYEAISAVMKGIKDAADSMKNAADKTADSLKEAAEAAAEIKKQEEDAKKEAEKQVSTVMKIINTIASTFKYLGEQADKYSKTSNQLIQNTGATKKESQDFRRELVLEVRELNKRTGKAYNAQVAYQNIVENVKGVTSDLESIGEMTTPLLLAQQGMNVDTHEVAQLLNKLYIRYSFSSNNMEDLLDGIRTNTTGNSADAAATLANIEKLRNIMALDIEDKDTLQNYMSAISDITSHAESQGMDSGLIADMIKQIWEGSYQDNPLLMNILSHGGMDGNATSYLRSGDEDSVRQVYNAIINGVTAIVGEQKDAYSRGITIKNTTGLDLDPAAEIYGALMSKNYETLEEFLDNRETRTVADTVEDKYVSFLQKMSNDISSIYRLLATFQENAGIGFSDFAGLIYLGTSAYKLIDTFSGGKIGDSILKGVTDKFLGSTRGTANASASNIGMGGPATTSATWLSRVGGGLANKGAVASAGAGAATLVGAAAGVGMAGYGIYQGVKDAKEGNSASAALNFTGAAAGAGGTAALLALGASNPIGWVALAVGGIGLLAANAVKAATTIGETAAIKAAYDDLEKTFKTQARDQEASLTEIKAQLLDYQNVMNDSTATEEQKLAAERGIDQQRKKLMESGILSQNDLVTAENAQVDALINLTDTYKKVTADWSDESTVLLGELEKADLAYAESLHGDLEEMLQDWNDSGALKEDGEKLAAVDSLFYDLYKSLQGQDNLDKNTQKIYDDLEKAYKDGTLTAKEANMIIDEGMYNTVFQNSNFGAENLTHAVQMMAATNSVGATAANELTAGLGEYYGEDAAYVVDQVAKLKSGKGTLSLEEAKAILDELKSKGFTSKTHPSAQIAEAAELWGLTGYAVGTNYITHDQLALLHEGEAVVPKKYNPAADGRITTRDYDELAESRESQQLARQSTELFSTLVEEIIEIKEFLKTWQQDNVVREKAAETRERNSYSRKAIVQYLANMS